MLVVTLFTACSASQIKMSDAGAQNEGQKDTKESFIWNKLHNKNSKIRFGTPADKKMITLGSNALPSYFNDMPAYKGKTSLNIKMPIGTEVLSPMDAEFIGYKNRHAKFRKVGQISRLEPFDDLELCFSSTDRNPAVIMCIYHVKSTPLLPKLFQNENCDVREDWDVGDSEVAKAGKIFYETNTANYGFSGIENDSCGARLGTKVKRGEIIAYSGTVGRNPHTGFRFKVWNENKNPIPPSGTIFDVNLHWVQPSLFFDWSCFKPEVKLESDVMTYPFDCNKL